MLALSPANFGPGCVVEVLASVYHQPSGSWKTFTEHFACSINYHRSGEFQRIHFYISFWFFVFKSHEKGGNSSKTIYTSSSVRKVMCHGRKDSAIFYRGRRARWINFIYLRQPNCSASFSRAKPNEIADDRSILTCWREYKGDDFAARSSRAHCGRVRSIMPAE